MKKILYTLLFCVFFSTYAHAESTPIKEMQATEFLSYLQQEKGKVILVNFFASWCEPCKYEIPDIMKIRDMYPEDELVIVGLSVDQNQQALEDFLEKRPINYPVYMAADSLAFAYNVNSIPHNIIYDTNLKMVYNKAGFMKLESLKGIIDDVR